MSEVTVVIDHELGALVMEGSQKRSDRFLAEMTRLLGSPRSVGCARPSGMLPPPSPIEIASTDTGYVRVAGYYHDSLIEGPGRRTSVLFSGCALRCKGCWVPDLHLASTGSLIDVGSLADLLLDPQHKRDGVSILGGEPFFQTEGLLALVRALRRRGCSHILVYTGHTYEALLAQARQQPAVIAILNNIDALIDGPYVKALADSAGPWTGSGNQRVIDLRATRQEGKVATCDKRL